MSKKISNLEQQFIYYAKIFKLPPYEREYRFDPERKWRFDFCFVHKKLGIECEGGIWTHGHTSPKVFIKDCEKYNRATELGFRILRYTDFEQDPAGIMEQIRRVLSGVHR